MKFGIRKETRALGLPDRDGPNVRLYYSAEAE